MNAGSLTRFPKQQLLGRSGRMNPGPGGTTVKGGGGSDTIVSRGTDTVPEKLGVSYPNGSSFGLAQTRESCPDDSIPELLGGRRPKGSSFGFKEQPKAGPTRRLMDINPMDELRAEGDAAKSRSDGALADLNSSIASLPKQNREEAKMEGLYSWGAESGQFTKVDGRKMRQYEVKEVFEGYSGEQKKAATERLLSSAKEQPREFEAAFAKGTEFYSGNALIQADGPIFNPGPGSAELQKGLEEVQRKSRKVMEASNGVMDKITTMEVVDLDDDAKALRTAPPNLDLFVSTASKPTGMASLSDQVSANLSSVGSGSGGLQNPDGFLIKL